MDSSSVLAKRPTPDAVLGRRGGHTLPPDLLREARRRLQALALLFAVLIAIDLIFAFDVARDVPLIIIADVLALTSSIVVFLLARWSRVSHGVALNAGLVLEVALCLIISTMTTVFFFREFDMVPMLDWCTPIIILFPLVVPTPPRKAVFTSLVAAAMPPLGILLLASEGFILPRPIAFPSTEVHPAFAAAWSPFIAAVIAGFASRWLYGLGRDVARARELGSYKLERCLGIGGMGEVWRARHRMLARPAAIKLMRPEVLGNAAGDSSEKTIRRFEREAQATARMCSPHTIRLFDFGVSDAGVFYYVMELLDGFDLETLIDRFGALPAPRVIHLLRQACDSLGEAHESGLIHRDIKPANIYVCRHGRDVDFVKLLDFGLVKSSRESADTPGVTGEFVVGGTPAFMAPEQALGESTADSRMDIYSLGCVAYWMLTGQLVFDGANPMEVMVQHAKAKPIPLSERSELPVPADLERIVMSCLEKDPAARPATADLLAEFLAGCADSTGWTSETAHHWWRVHHPLAGRD